MNQRLLTASALASLLMLGIAAPAAAQEKEKCYGIAEAGKNDCANLSGTHSCAGQAKESMSPAEWKYVAKGTCASMKGLSAEEAKQKVAMMKK